MRIKAALYNADHLEYGLVTIPFPIPQDQYNDAIKMLEALDIGDPRAKDCMVEEIEGCVPSLKCLEGHRINVDELDYLVKRLDSFSDGELVQFQGMAAKMGPLLKRPVPWNRKASLISMPCAPPSQSWRRQIEPN